MMTALARRSRSNDRGFSLVEVLVMMVLIAIIGTAALYAGAGAAKAQSSSSRTDAVLQYGNGILERARTVSYEQLGFPTASCPTEAARGACESVLVPAGAQWAPSSEAGGGDFAPTASAPAGRCAMPAAAGTYCRPDVRITARNGSAIMLDVYTTVSWSTKPAPGKAYTMGVKRVTVTLADQGKADPMTVAADRAAVIGEAVPTWAQGSNAAPGPSNATVSVTPGDGDAAGTVTVATSGVAAWQLIAASNSVSLNDPQWYANPSNVIASGNGSAPTTTVNVPTSVGCYRVRYEDALGQVGFTPVRCNGTLVASAATDSTLSLTWSAAAARSGGYVLHRWSGAGAPAVGTGCLTQDDYSRATSAPATENLSATQSGLARATTYTYQVVAPLSDAVSAGARWCSNVVRATTAPAPPTITNVATGVSSFRSATITFTPVAGASGYVVEYATTASFAAVAGSVSVAGSATSATTTLSGTGVDYFFRARALVAGPPAASSVNSAVVAKSLPLAAPRITVTSIPGNAGALDVSWPAVPGAAGYSLAWSGAPSMTSPTTSAPACSSGTCTTRLAVSGETDNTYSVRLTATAGAQSVSSGVATLATGATVYSCPSGGNLSGTTCSVASSSFGATNTPYYNTSYSCPGPSSVRNNALYSSYGGNPGPGYDGATVRYSLSGTSCARIQTNYNIPSWDSVYLSRSTTTLATQNFGGSNYTTCGPNYVSRNWRNIWQYNSTTRYDDRLSRSCYSFDATTYQPATVSYAGPYNRYSCPSGTTLSGSTCTRPASSYAATSATPPARSVSA